jgi:hypothetical protein
VHPVHRRDGPTQALEGLGGIVGHETLNRLADDALLGPV